MGNFERMDDTFEHWLGDIKYNYKEVGLYPFMARVGVVKYRPPRHECFEYLINLGVGAIEKVLYHKGEVSGNLTFVFPERHMSVHEQRSFMWCLSRHPTVDKVTQVDIITSCPMIVGDFHSYMMRVLTWPEDENELIPFVNGPDSAMNPNTKDDADFIDD